MKTGVIYHESNIETMKRMPDNSVHSIVTDAPYGLGKEPNAVEMLKAWVAGEDKEVSGAGFMGKKWDSFVPQPKFWKEAFRVLKPGGHVLCFFGTRTYDWGVMAMRIAGFEIRDRFQWIFDNSEQRDGFIDSLSPEQKQNFSQLLKSGDNEVFWSFGSGFPKGNNISKSIDKRGGVNISWFGEWLRDWRKTNNITQKEIAILFPSKTGKTTGCVANWELGFNLPTAEQFSIIVEHFKLPFDSLKEAEREVVGKYNEGDRGSASVLNNSQSGFSSGDITKAATSEAKKWEGWNTGIKPANEPIVLARKPISEKTIAANVLRHGTGGVNIGKCKIGEKNKGRYPANIIHDGSEEVVSRFPETSKAGNIKKSIFNKDLGNVFGKYNKTFGNPKIKNDNGGSASRFFYCAKVSKKERTNNGTVENKHPTIKPIKLMRYLCRLITPPDGIVYDPFAGSGSTGMAAEEEGFKFIGSEMELESAKTGNLRMGAKEEVIDSLLNENSLDLVKMDKEIDMVLEIETKESLDKFIKEQRTEPTLKDFFEIYTDGSALAKEGHKDNRKGGFGIVFIKNDEVLETFNEGMYPTTTGRMELWAAYAALMTLKPKNKATIYSDSMYVVNSFNKGWLEKWEKEGWTYRKNGDLLEKILKEYRKFPKKAIKFVHVKGHSGNKYNEMADKLASYKNFINFTKDEV